MFVVVCNLESVVDDPEHVGLFGVFEGVSNRLRFFVAPSDELSFKLSAK